MFGGKNRLSSISRTPRPGYIRAMAVMDDFPAAPTLVVRDRPKPRRLVTLKDARDYVEEAMRTGRPQPWREVWHRLRAVTDEEDAIAAIGDLRELLAEEDLLLPSGGGPKA
jgi:hypothetical protein